MKKIALVTPAKNEETNIPSIVKSIALQTYLPDTWVFVNDLSEDKTVELLKTEYGKYETLKQCKLYIIDNETKLLEYGLGKKYSSVTRFGFDYIEKLEKENNDEFDFIGILDCDVFPYPNYYEELIKRFESDIKLGIASGGTQHEIDTGLTSIVYPKHAAGMMRLWRRECFSQTGYYPSISQDAVSEARAKMLGWKTRSYKEIEADMRSMGKKSKYEYYGKSYYVRWVSPIIVYLHYLKLQHIGKKEDAEHFILGYKTAKKERIERLDDKLAKKYFRHQVFYKLIGR